eukprot:jgi/Chlat1/5553/Chrsp369S00845
MLGAAVSLVESLPAWLSSSSAAYAADGSVCRWPARPRRRPAARSQRHSRSSRSRKQHALCMAASQDAATTAEQQEPPRMAVTQDDDHAVGISGYAHTDNVEEATMRHVSSRSQPSFKGTSIEIRDLVKQYSTKTGYFLAVDNVSLIIRPGALMALLGPSGSGKTTLLRTIAGLDNPTSGSVFFDGEDVTDSRVQDRGIGMVFQNYALFKHMTVAENVGFGPYIQRQSKARIKTKVKELLELIQLPNLGNRFPQELSGGQRQRVALARALACEPRVLLLDEPFGALDAVVRQDLRVWLKELHHSLGMTTIFVTHDQEEAMEVGSPEDVWERPANPFTMNFLGEVNSLPATCKAVRETGIRTQKPSVLLRPTDVVVYDRPPTDRNTTPAVISDVINVGWEVRYELKYDDGQRITMVMDRAEYEEQPMAATDRVYVELDPACLMPYDRNELL